jgi:hypothetical protein
MVQMIQKFTPALLERIDYFSRFSLNLHEVPSIPGRSKARTSQGN